MREKIVLNKISSTPMGVQHHGRLSADMMEDEAEKIGKSIHKVARE